MLVKRSPMALYTVLIRGELFGTHQLILFQVWSLKASNLLQGWMQYSLSQKFSVSISDFEHNLIVTLSKICHLGKLKMSLWGCSFLKSMENKIFNEKWRRMYFRNILRNCTVSSLPKYLRWCICLGVIMKDTKGNVEKQIGQKPSTYSTPFSVQRVIETSERRKEFWD